MSELVLPTTPLHKVATTRARGWVLYVRTGSKEPRNVT